MAHNITFNEFKDFGGLISESEAIDLIDAVYRWGDSRFLVRSMSWPKHPRRRGEHEIMYMGGPGGDLTHVISLSRRAIESGFRDGGHCGGNYPAPTLRMAVFMVLAHELQHANQIELHQGKVSFFGKRRSKYVKRPCERDARAFVDDNMDLIAAIAGHSIGSKRFASPTMVATKDELSVISETLENAREVFLSDVTYELRSSGINNPTNVEKISKMLSAKGIQVRTG